MDNVQGVGTPVAPSPEGQAVSPSQTPSSDAQSGSVGTDAARTDGQSSAGQEGLILGKFKSSEDLAKAYQELESHNKKVEMDRAEMEKLFVPQPESPSTAPQGPAAVPDSDDPLAPVVDALAPKLTGEVNRLISPVLARMEIDSMVRKYGDAFVSVAQDVKAKQSQNPSLSLEDAYKLASFDRLQRTSQEQSNQRAAQAEQQAVKAQVESSQPSGQRPQNLDQAMQDKTVPTEEILQALGPEYESFRRGYENKRSRLDTLRRFSQRQ